MSQGERRRVNGRFYVGFVNLDVGRQYRLKLKPAWTTQDCLELGNEDGDNEFNVAVRENAGTHRDYAPVFDRVVR